MEANENTIIIVGAGASCPYGLPLGEDLISLIKYGRGESEQSDVVKKIIDRLDKREDTSNNKLSDYKDFINSCFVNESDEEKYLVFENDDLATFNILINMADPWTIDTFLSSIVENYQNINIPETFYYLGPLKDRENEWREQKALKYQEIGKFYISAIINYFEYLNKDNSSDPEDNWIKYLLFQSFNYIKNKASNLDEAIGSLPYFVTFNYDNILERRIYNFFNSSLLIGCKWEEFKKKIEAKITHVYGECSVWTPDNILKEEDRISSEIKKINEKAKHIEIYREENGADGLKTKNGNSLNATSVKTFIRNKIRDIGVRKGANLIFLGYGWDRINNEVLFESESKFDKLLQTGWWKNKSMNKENLENKNKQKFSVYASTYNASREHIEFLTESGINEIAVFDSLTYREAPSDWREDRQKLHEFNSLSFKCSDTLKRASFKLKYFRK